VPAKPPAPKKTSVTAVAGAIVLGIIIVIALGIYLYRRTRRQRLINDALAYDPTTVDMIAQDEKRRQNGKQNRWFDTLRLTMDDYTRYPSLLPVQTTFTEEYDARRGTPNSFGPVSLPLSAVLREDLANPPGPATPSGPVTPSSFEADGPLQPFNEHYGFEPSFETSFWPYADNSPPSSLTSPDPFRDPGPRRG
jgi:hypothetical protein